MGEEYKNINIERKYKTIVERAQKKPSLFRENEYIQAALFRPDLYRLSLEMGPNCNLKCFHCGCNNGPDRKGLPSLEVVTKTLSDSIRTGILRLALTDGEPLRNENKEVLKAIGRYSRAFSTHIITNSTFAKTPKSAKKWFSYLQDIGFSFSKEYPTTMNVSLGEMYPSSIKHCSNILDAIKEVSPKLYPGDFLTFMQVGTSEKQDRERIIGLLELIEKNFGKRKKEKIRQKDNGRKIEIWAYPNEGKSIPIDWFLCGPFGRAYNLSFLDKIYPIRKFKPGDLNIDPHNAGRLTVFYNGNVSFSDCFGDFERNQPYGNIKKEHMMTILGRIRSDVFFQAYKLGGLGLLYYAAQKVNHDFSVTGRSSVDVMKAIFQNRELIDEIRNYFTKKGVIDSYKEHFSKIDLRKKSFI